MNKLTLRRVMRHNRHNPLSASSGALMLGGAALAGGGYYAVDNARNPSSPSATLETAGDIGIVAGLAATGAGLGSLIHGKMGGLIGAVLLPAAVIGVRYATRAAGAPLVP